MRLICLFLILFCAVTQGFAAKAASGAIEVELFSPQGPAKNVRQVTARFSQAMVRFGDPRAESPFDIDCPAKGTGHWVDDRNWAMDFAEDLPAGLRCVFKLKAAGQSQSAAPDGRSKLFFFDTGGPSVIDSLPEQGRDDVDENPSFLLKLDAAATPESVIAHAHCEVEGLGERIATRLLQGGERDKWLSGPLRSQYPYFFADTPDERMAVLDCRRQFAPGSKLRLVWGAGINSPHGVSTRQDQVLEFKVRPAFTARFQCEKLNARAHCIPLLPASLQFSAPVPADQALRARLEDGQGKLYPVTMDDPLLKPVVTAIKFKGPFPENSRLKLVLPADLADDSGRVLQNAAQFPLDVEMDEYPPLAKFNGQFGILEANEGGMLPVTLRTLEASVSARQAMPGQEDIPGKWQRLDQSDTVIASWLRKVEKAGDERFEELPKQHEEDPSQYRNLTGAKSVFEGADKTVSFDMPKPNGARAFEVVGIPLKTPGFYVVELASPRLGAALLGEPRPRYVATSALVTNMAVHFKKGRESSLVWVTTLDQAKPVADAEVRISDFCTGQEFWRGRTGQDGTASIDGAGLLPELDAGTGCYEGSTLHPLFVSARSGGDMSFVLSGWSKGIQPYDFDLSVADAGAAKLAHTVFDRSLFRAGETVSMKIFLRQRAAAGFSAYLGDRPDTLEISHVGSDEKHTVPLAFDSQGIAEARWEIPKEAKLGNYEVRLRNGEEWVADTGGFRVEQFRVPGMKASIQPSADFLVNAKEATVDLAVNYLSGGGASQLPVKLRSQVRSHKVEFAAYDDFQFGGEAVQEGIVADTITEDQETASPAQVLPLTLGRTGVARATIPGLPKVETPKELLTELEYQDANGQLLSVSRLVPLLPAKVLLGIKQDGWLASPELLRFQVLALDPRGQPIQSQSIKVELFKRTTYSYRKRLIGGFYDYEHKIGHKKLDQGCEGRTDKTGIVTCEIKPGTSGDLILRATAEDGQGNLAFSTRDVWVAGAEDWWFDQSPSDRMDVLPEQKSLEVGQKARLQVRMPFREATALVTVEREGVLDHYVIPVSGKSPVVEVPVKSQYAPNVYVSVLAVRGRAREDFAWFRELAGKMGFKLEDKSVTALVDLNKPAFRLGMAQLAVGWSPNRLMVKVEADRNTYKARERAKVKVKVSRADGGPLPQQAEIALAAVDEGLLELKPNSSWQLLDAMMGKRGIEVYTSTAQMQVVGKRHYGRKAIPHGGGGGRQTTRELFDTLLLWRGRIPLNAEGGAEIEVPLNDSLSAFRLTAVASAGQGFFGTGETRIITRSEVMLYSGLLPLVREGDSYPAIFTVRNGADHALALTAKARWISEPKSNSSGKSSVSNADGVTAGEGRWQELQAISVDLEPGEAKTLSWNMAAPLDARKLTWDVGVENADGSARDRLLVAQDVIPVWPVQVYQATLAQIAPSFTLPIETPKDAIAGRGGVRVSLRANLGGGLAGVLDYMGRYPYSCMEQRVSKAIVLQDKELWGAVMQSLPAFIDQDGLAKYFATDHLNGSDTLTAYLLAIADESGRAIPTPLRDKMLDGLKEFAAGKLRRSAVMDAADLSLRKLSAIEALSRYGLANPEMLDSITIQPMLWPTSAVLDWINILKRISAIPQRDVRLQEASQIIRSRLNLQGTSLGFSTEANDRLWWLMVSVDENAVRTVLSLLDQDQWRTDLPRLASGALHRQNHGHWDTTVANAWGTLAIKKFSAKFETVSVNGDTQANMAGVAKGVQWTESNQQSVLDFPWQEGVQTLFLQHRGTGKPWAIVQSLAALPLKQASFSGYGIRRRVEPVEQREAGIWSRGDVVRVRLELEAQADRAWVVVDAPIPAGASILGSGLGGDSKLLTQGEKSDGGIWPSFEERSHEAYRAYYEYVPKGKWSLEYTLRLNSPGKFLLSATRVEALYTPEMFGELANEAWEIH